MSPPCPPTSGTAASRPSARCSSCGRTPPPSCPRSTRPARCRRPRCSSDAPARVPRGVVICGLGTLEDPLVGAVVFFVLRELLADYGSWYMILLGALAVGAMLAYPAGLWGLVADRWDIRLFPVQRRVRLDER